MLYTDIGNCLTFHASGEISCLFTKAGHILQCGKSFIIIIKYSNILQGKYVVAPSFNFLAYSMNVIQFKTNYKRNLHTQAHICTL